MNRGQFVCEYIREQDESANSYLYAFPCLFMRVKPEFLKLDLTKQLPDSVYIFLFNT